MLHIKNKYEIVMTKIIHCIIINHYELLRTLINKYKHGYTVFLLNIICCAILLNNVGINIYFMIISLPIYFCPLE